MFCPIGIISKQFNSLTAIDTFSCLSGPEVTHQMRCKRSEFDSRLWQGNLCLLFCFVVVACLHSCPKHIYCHEICNTMHNVNLFSILYILQNLQPIIRIYQDTDLASLSFPRVVTAITREVKELHAQLSRLVLQ